MTVEQIAIGAVAAVVAMWPQVMAAARRFLTKPQPAKPEAAVSFEVAVQNLSLVRSRLLATALLAEEQRKAIDTLTLALVAGSEK